MSWGISAIQGTVSLVDKKELNCTIIVKGIYRKFREWYKLIKDREGYSKESLISRIDNTYFNNDDIKKLGL